MAHREPSAAEIGADQAKPAAQARTPTAVWVHDGLVCVAVIDLPPPQEPGGVCRCPACHGALQADWAKVFL
jgi:hypothetical protein